MKIKMLGLLFYTAGCLTLHAGPGTNAGPAFPIMSPDHPSTWEVGFNEKVGQRLRWDAKEGKLLLDVTYSRIPYFDTEQQFDFVTYTMTFPNVALDQYGNFFVPAGRHGKIVVGYLANGPFGKQVYLNRDIYLSAHRESGRLKAMLLLKHTR